MSGAPVAVTGLGAVSGFGRGVEPLWRGLVAGRRAIGDFTRFDHSAYRTHVAAEVPATSALAADPRRSLADRFALWAAAEALTQSGLPSRLDDLSAGVFFGSATGGMVESERYFAGQLAGDRRRRDLSLLVAQPPGAPAEAVARAHGVGGPVETVVSACASATLVLAAALDALRAGELEIALAGGADSLCRLTFAGFNSLRAVDPRACRPFRADREGMSLGEGAAVLVLESTERARRRGARILGWLAGTGAACDAYHMTSPDPAGAGVLRAVRGALADAALPPEAIDFVNVHGTGTPHNDAAEAKMLAAVFGERAAAVPITSTKGAVGHLLGSAGAIEAVATLLCLEHGVVHPTPGEDSSDPALGVDLVVGSARALPGARHALSTNLAFGGANAAAIFSRGEPG